MYEFISNGENMTTGIQNGRQINFISTVKKEGNLKLQNQKTFRSKSLYILIYITTDDLVQD